MAASVETMTFQDFDLKDVYNRIDAALLHAETRNFVIEFDGSTAQSAQDVDEEAMKTYLKTNRPSTSSTRWINVFGPERQKRLVKVLSDRYNFTPRLLGIMCSGHNDPSPVPSKFQHNGHIHDKWHPISTTRLSAFHALDPEKNIVPNKKRNENPMLNINHYKVVKEVWHWCSIDWSPKYICLGYNSLSDTTSISIDSHDEHAGEDFGAIRVSRDKPKGTRTWTWLVLCDDGTVISFYETPFPYQRGGLTPIQESLLCVIRRNLHNVLKQLSKVNDVPRKENPINTLDIRPGLESNQSTSIELADSPSLLFYYLFDDWYTTYNLVAKSEHQYARQLDGLREDMFAEPHVILINQLHQYGRELAVLKRMYQSYALIIERVLSRQKPMNIAPGRGSDRQNRRDKPQLPQESDASVQDKVSHPAGAETLGVPLSSAATVRFERLLDRINLYALSEIQECLDEKESLVFMNFNLLTMKESQAVERLTRITILLAKVTILFMPVSLMTAYFSTQLLNMENKYTIKTYWICFAVIMLLSLLFLVVFGAASGTSEGKPIYRSLTGTVWDSALGRVHARSLRKHRKEN